jgi:DNA-directed RNA polymerase subunit beta
MPTIKNERKYLTKKPIILPNLIEIQTDSYKWFVEKGLGELFEEISPIVDFTGDKMELTFSDYFFEKPKYDEFFARENYLTYKAPLRVKLTLLIKETGEVKDQEVFLGDFPMMTDRGTFIINGVERVVVNQIVRSYGVLFVNDEVNGRKLFGAKIVPQRGAWLEIETSYKDVLSVRIDRRRRLPITTFLRAMGYGSNEELKAIFKEFDNNPDHHFFEATLAKDPATDHKSGVLETYRRIRPGEMATYENAKSLLDSMFFDLKRYDLSKVGRYKINQRLNQNLPIILENRILRKEDVADIVKEVLRLNNTPGSEQDDIDHLSNRRIRSVGELVQDRTRVGTMRLERIVKDRMSVIDPNTITPAMLINARPIIAVLQEFFASSQLSQFMNQTNPLAELEHKRCLSAIGPGGLSRERAGFEARDVHSSHYGRICPIETPEGPNIGLVGYLASYAKINNYGFIETPYRPIISKLPANSDKLVGHILNEKIIDSKTKKLIVDAGTEITSVVQNKISKIKKEIKIYPYISNKIVYLNAAEEEMYIVAPSPFSENAKVDEKNQIMEPKIVVRKYGKPDVEAIENVDYIGITPEQIISISTALIPFLEHTDGVRASMGANMERQAVPLIKPHSPIVGTGLEEVTARDSGQLVIATGDGKVTHVDAATIIVKEKSQEHLYKLINFTRSNQGTCLHQRPVVEVGMDINKGDILADSMATDQGELALGENITVAFMPWEGCNYEDAIIISSKLVENDTYSSIHIERYAIEIRDTKLGPEVVTRDIPNVAEETLRNLDEFGVIRIGAEIKSGDILVGKITPKGETELSAEERLLRAIFGEKAKDVRDTSLRLPHGERGRVVDVKIFSKEKGAELAAGVFQMIEVSVAQLRKVSIGDKLAGRYGNKGVISKILKEEDMPFLPDGTPVDIILNPLGVISRMNIGQIFETNLGWALSKLGYKIANPVFQCVGEDFIKKELTRAGFSSDGTTVLYDGRTGGRFDRKVVVGKIYIMKLIHLVDDKMHARSIGPYSMVTQQPLGGKAQFGGQRFGEMEVWALEAYGAAHTLQEMLTIKSDDVVGRSKAYEAIIKGEPIAQVSTPESFNVLVKELQSLGLSVDLLNGKK